MNTMTKAMTSGWNDFKIKKTLTAPNNPAVLAYLKAAREGKGLADKFFKDSKKAQKTK
jgi:hypothetical protein